MPKKKNRDTDSTQIPAKKKRGESSETTPSKKKQKAEPALSTSLLKPAPLATGLTLAIVIGCPDLDLHIRTAIEQHAAQGKHNGGITMPKDCHVLAVHAGPPRVAEQAATYAKMSSRHYDENNPKIISVGTKRVYNWCSTEGFEGLQRLLNKFKRGLLTIVQPVDAQIRPDVVQNITKIDAIARARNMRILMLVHVAQRAEACALENLSEEHIEIERCEPGPGAHIAFSIKLVGMDLLHPLGVGHAMCEVKLKEQRYVRKFTKFVAVKLEDRAIWMRRAEEKSLQEIADEFGIAHRSTVMRRLSTMRTPDPEEVVKGWFERCADMLDLQSRKDPGERGNSRFQLPKADAAK